MLVKFNELKQILKKNVARTREHKKIIDNVITNGS